MVRKSVTVTESAYSTRLNMHETKEITFETAFNVNAEFARNGLHLWLGVYKTSRYRTNINCKKKYFIQFHSTSYSGSNVQSLNVCISVCSKMVQDIIIMCCHRCNRKDKRRDGPGMRKGWEKYGVWEMQEVTDMTPFYSTSFSTLYVASTQEMRKQPLGLYCCHLAIK